MKKLLVALLLTTTISGTAVGVTSFIRDNFNTSTASTTDKTLTEAEKKNQYDAGFEAGKKSQSAVIKEYLAKVESLNTQVLEITTERDENIAKVKELNDQLEDINYLLDSVTKEKESALETVSTLEAEKQELEEQLKQTSASNQEAIDELNASIANKEAEIETLNASIAEYNTQITDLNDEITVLTTTKQSLEADVQAKTTQIDQLNTKVNELQNTISGIENGQKVVVTYIVNNTKTTQIVDVNSHPTFPEVVVPEKYEFTGWTIGESTQTVDENWEIVSSITFIANVNKINYLEQYSLSQIAEIINAGNAQEYFRIGDTKHIQNDSFENVITLIGFNHDDLADGSGKAGATFAFMDGVDSLDLFPELKAFAKTVSKKTLNFEPIEREEDGITETVGFNTSITNDSVQEFFLSAVEVLGSNIAENGLGGTYLDLYLQEGSQYEYFVNSSNFFVSENIDISNGIPLRSKMISSFDVLEDAVVRMDGRVCTSSDCSVSLIKAFCI